MLNPELERLLSAARRELPFACGGVMAMGGGHCIKRRILFCLCFVRRSHSKYLVRSRRFRKADVFQAHYFSKLLLLVLSKTVLHEFIICFCFPLPLVLASDAIFGVSVAKRNL